MQFSNVRECARSIGAHLLIGHYQGDATSAMDAALQSLRLDNRALSNLSRITRRSHAPLQMERDSPAGEDFEVPVKQSGMGVNNHSAGTLGWDVTSHLVSMMLWLSHLYNVRGSLKPATYFLHQAADLAQTMNAPRLHAKVIARQIDLDVAAGRHEEANHKLVQLVQMSRAVRVPIFGVKRC
jgi:separase